MAMADVDGGGWWCVFERLNFRVMSKNVIYLRGTMVIKKNYATV